LLQGTFQLLPWKLVEDPNAVRDEAGRIANDINMSEHLSRNKGRLKEIVLYSNMLLAYREVDLGGI